MRLMLGCAALAWMLATGAHAREHPRFDVAPPPAWVEPLGWDRKVPVAPDAADGIQYLLADDQVRVGPDGAVERYKHLVWRILTTTGVENGSELRVSFDPSYEQLMLHAAVLHRGERRLDALHPADVKVIQQEEELERRQYDGRLTAVAFLRGVRTGDTVEVAYTIRGSNPVFEGRFAHALPLAWDVPVARLAIRLLAAEGRTIAMRTHGLEIAPVVSRHDGFVDQRWERAPAPAVTFEDDIPYDIDEEPWLQLSEWRTWGEVASWASAMQQIPQPDPTMQQELARWRSLPEEERILEAVRFVQDEVRYLGIELGPHSHRPHMPSEVFERRFGDCKDKSFLLVTLLAALGVEAEPALVATDVREGLDRRLPSPIEFDHVVVRAKLRGRWWWIDPTVTLERGPLASRQVLPFRRALPVRAGSVLVPIDDPPAARLAVTSTLTVPAFGEKGALEVRTRWEGARATRVRQRLAEEPIQRVARSWHDFYARMYPGIEPDGSPEVKDEAATGALEVVERYVLPPVREGEEYEFRAAELIKDLPDFAHLLRKQPLAVAHPVEVRETIRVVLPGVPDVEPDVKRIDCSAARFRREIRAEGRSIVAEMSYVTLSDRIAAQDAPAYASAIREMRRHTGFTMPLAIAHPGRETDAPGRGIARVIGGLSAFGAVLLGIGFLANGGAGRVRSWARRRAFARKLRVDQGDSPATAIVFPDRSQLDQEVARARCACGGSLLLAGAIEPVWLDGSEISVVPLACACCGATRRLYAAVRERYHR